jgi:putative SOS response-associated peptidase YedK
MSKEHGAQPQKPQLVYRRHPETGKAVEGYLRWGFIPHDAVTRPKVQPIHARAETITE